MAIEATIFDDIPIAGSSNFRWTLRAGTQATFQTFDIPTRFLERILNVAGQKTDFTINVIPSNAPAFKIEKLWFIEQVPFDNPRMSRVRFADRRWFWKYGHILRRYNIRRNVGVKGIKNNMAFGLQQIIPSVWYAAWSLEKNINPPEGKWTAQSILRDILVTAFKTEFEYTGKFDINDIVIRKNLIDALVGLPIENLIIDDPTDQAIARTLSYIPAAGLYVDLQGKVVVYNKSNFKEREQLSPEVQMDKDFRLEGHIVGGGHAEFISNRFLRPSKIVVLFTREHEVRFDFEEESTFKEKDTQAEGAVDDTRFIANVLPIPDHELKIPGNPTPSAQGTWESIGNVLEAWNNKPFPTNAKFQRIDFDLIRRAAIPFRNFWAAIALQGFQDPNADWMARIAALSQHWRRTFRINPRWMDRILSLRAYRIATIDPSTGTRAPAPAYSDFSIIGNQRSALQRMIKDKAHLGMNVKGYPQKVDANGIGIIDENTKSAPAEVRISDADQGIVHIDYVVDPNRVFDIILPGRISGEWSPSGDFSEDTPIAFDEVRSVNYTSVSLEAGHKVSIILTCVPASPNSEEQLYKIEVDPKELLGGRGEIQIDGGRVIQALGKNIVADGPVWEIRVGAGVETARFFWRDSDAKEIEKAFGIDSLGGRGGLFFVDEPKIKPINEDNNTNPSNAASLNAIAKAIALRIYASLNDRLVGSVTKRINPSTTLDGWLDEIAHEIKQNGEATTRMNFPERTEMFDMASFLPDSVRAIIYKFPQKG